MYFCEQWFRYECMAEGLGIEKVKLIPDGNAMFTGLMNQLVTKTPNGFGLRSWRYACIIEEE